MSNKGYAWATSPSVGGPSDAVLSILLEGPATVKDIRSRTGLTPDNVTGACTTQLRLGNITRMDAPLGGRGVKHQATYAITEQGVRRITPHLLEDQMETMGYRKLALDGKVIAAKPAKDGGIWIKYA